MTVSQIDEYIEMIGDGKLRSMVRQLVHEPRICFDCERLGFDEAPAGSYVHHSYAGGLAEHTVAVVRLALTMCDLIEGVYGGEIDRDVVLAGAILHDVMKPYVYASSGQGGFVSSPLGERIDHLSLLVAEMYARGFPLDVVHVAAAHHGNESPVKPRTVEALVVSVADLADSEFNQKLLRAAEYLLKQAGREARGLTSREALRVVRAKAAGGLDGVRRLGGGES